MKVILLTKVKNLGNLGELITVKSGYARNYLFPNQQAMLANKENISIVETQKRELKRKLDEKLKIAYDRIEKIKSLNTIIILAKSGEEGKLFGSIGSRDISKSISDLGVIVNKNEIRLPYGVLRNIGEHTVIFCPHNEIKFDVKINIISDIIKI